MGYRLANDSLIRQKSEELRIPFENLLAAMVLEEIIQRIAVSAYAESFWLKNVNNLNLESYQKKVCMNLEYFMMETEKLHYKKADVSVMFSELFKNFKKDAIHWNYSLKENMGVLYVSMTATVNAIKVPVKIKIYRISDDKLKPKVCDIHLLTSNEKRLSLRCFPNEQVLVDKFLYIMSMLELINNMSPYYEIYELLRKENISGRKVYELLADGCSEHGIEIEKERFELVCAYKNNRYMQKKWKTYLRHEKKENPEWQDVVDILERFFGVIWKNICINVVYLGDWMPELGRFID